MNVSIHCSQIVGDFLVLVIGRFNPRQAHFKESLHSGVMHRINPSAASDGQASARRTWCDGVKTIGWLLR
jgi:hypothetical protein